MHYVYQDFSKHDKKILQEQVELGTRREARLFLFDTLKVYMDTMAIDHDDYRQPYWELADRFKTFSKEFVARYDGYRHRVIPRLIAELWCIQGRRF